MLKRLDRWLIEKLDRGNYWGRSLALGVGMAVTWFYLLYLAATDWEELRRMIWVEVLFLLLLPLFFWAAPALIWMGLRERAGKPKLPPLLMPCAGLFINCLAALFWLVVIWAGLMLDKPIGLKELTLQALTLVGIAFGALGVDRVVAREERDNHQTGKRRAPAHAT